MKRPTNHLEQLVRDVEVVLEFCFQRRRRHTDVQDACRDFVRRGRLDTLDFLLDAVDTLGRFDRRHGRALLRLRAALRHYPDQRTALRARLDAIGYTTNKGATS